MKIILFVVFVSSTALAKTDYYRSGLEISKNKDELSLRVLARKSFQSKLSYEQWKAWRKLLHERPGVGWDFIVKWDSIQFPQNQNKNSILFEKKINEINQLMVEQKFKEASEVSLKLLRYLKKKQSNFRQENFFLYQSVLHSLGRAFYSYGKFKDSVEIYQMISLHYPFIRQVQFEKMWAAFRAGNYSTALGAIASQKSSYFSQFLEPEVYLLEYYLFRKLCRPEDVQHVFESAKAFKGILEKGKYSLADWVRRDLETLNLFKISKLPYPNSLQGIISKQDHAKEKKKIMDHLVSRYTPDLKRIETEMEKVISYMNLAAEATRKELPEVIRIPGISQILSSKTEMWLVEDLEDWIDEIGKHTYIGQSRCVANTVKK